MVIFSIEKPDLPESGNDAVDMNMSKMENVFKG